MKNALPAVGTPLRAMLWLALLVLPILAAWQWERHRLGARQQPLIEAQARELDRQLARFGFVPRLLAQDPRLVEALSATADSATRRDADRLLAMVQGESRLAFAFLMDRDGLTIASSNAGSASSFVGQNYGFRPYFKRAIAGEHATHFAVGATTGRPGYFVASPVLGGQGDLIGVVVAKTELDALVDVWRQQAHDTVVLDALGVAILSTDPELLYVPRRALAADERAEIEQERRYPLATERLLESGARTLGPQQALLREPWTLQAVIAADAVRWATARDVAMLAAAVALGWVSVRLLGHRRRLAAARQRDADQLAHEVGLRTRQLESAQTALIARSNFEMLGRMSAAINHEINQPLASLRLNLASARTLLERHDTDRAELSQIVIDSDRTTQRIARVIATLRSVAAAPAQPRDTVGVAELFADVVDTLARERPRTRERVIVEEQPVGACVRGDAVQLQQALLNLLNNAFDACLDRPDATVGLLAVEQSDRRVALSVSDRGSGVAHALEERLFEPFISTQTRAGGLGLGLALAREIAERHGGTLDYRANEPCGAIFTLTLPSADVT